MSDMLPRFPMFNEPYSTFADAEVFAHGFEPFTAREASADGYNVLLRKLRQMLRTSTRKALRMQARTMRVAAWVAALFHTIQHVLSLGAQPEMSRITAQPVVAGVQDHLCALARPGSWRARKRRIVVKLVSQAVRHVLPSRPLQLSVSIGSGRQLPQPALVRSLDVHPRPKVGGRLWDSYHA